MDPNLLARSSSELNNKRAYYNEPRTDPTAEEELKAKAFVSTLETQLTSHEVLASAKNIYTCNAETLILVILKEKSAFHIEIKVESIKT